MNAVAAPSGCSWDDPALSELVVRKRRDGCAEAMLQLDGLRSARQTLALEARLQAVPGLGRFAIERASRRLRLSWNPATTNLATLVAACQQAGCEARPLPREALVDARRQQAHMALRRLLVAGLFAMQAMMFAFVLYLDHLAAIDATTRTLFRWLSLLAAVPVLAWAAVPFYRQALVDWRQRRLGTESVVTVAVLLIAAGSFVALVRDHGEVYFESISMLIFVLLLGRWLEMRARHRSAEVASAALDGAALLARRKSPRGALETVPVARLRVGDWVCVCAGERVPADGRMLAGHGVRVDDSVLTGEARARRCEKGDRLLAGSRVLVGELEMTVARPVSQGTLARLTALAQGAAERAHDRASDQRAGRFALRVLVLAGLTALGWLWLDPARALGATVAVLVVACPCAFALAAPLVAARAMALLGRQGVWLVDGRVLAPLSRAEVALFDKTGTLTEPAIDGTAIQDDDTRHRLAQAAALAAGSEHPLAQAVCRAAGALSATPAGPATEVREQPGGGLCGRIDGRWMRLGHAAFACPGQTLAAGTDESLVLADERGPLAVFPLREALREEAAGAVAGLQAAGLRVGLLSGDAEPRVAAVARAVQADWHVARCLPADKLARVETARAAGQVVLAVGDGSNDAPLLAAADVSVALVRGTDLARTHAHILLAGSLDKLLVAREVAQQARRILAQNERCALAWNLFAVPFAALGLVSPWLAVLGMSLSSLAVVLNALRLRLPVTAARVPLSSQEGMPA